MHGIVELIDRWGAEWATLVVALVWQSTLVALLVAAAAYAIARSSPAIRYWLWQIVAVKLLVLPLWSLALVVPWLPGATSPIAMPAAASNELPAVVGPHPLATNTAAPDRPLVERAKPPLAELSWRGWLLLGWAAIVVLQIGRLAIQRVRLARLLGHTVTGDERLVAAVGQVAARLKLDSVPRVVTTELDCSPFVCGIVRPTLVLPRELAETLNATQREQVVAHELAHVKRRIPQIAQMLFFFHPVAHLASYRIRLERELACDQWAMIVTGRGPGEYVDTLVRVVSSASCPGIFRTSATSLDGGVPQATNPEQRP